MFGFSKPSTFREKNFSEKRRRIFGESRFPFGLSKKRAAPLDPEFSIDGFLSRLQNFQKVFDKPLLPPKPKAPKLPLSTKCFVEVFKRLPPKDLLNLRLVCKDFDRIIQNHALELPRTPSPRVVLCRNEWGNYTRGRSDGPSDDLMLEEIDRPLRHLTTPTVTLEGITINSKVIRYLHRSFKYQIAELIFDECYFALG